jgi:hypothetical protein
MGADEWIDDAMFSSGVGVDTTIHEQARLSRSLVQAGGGSWTLGGSTNVDNHRFIVYNNILYCMVMLVPAAAATRLYSYNPSAETWTLVATPASFIGRSITTFDGYLVIAGIGGGSAKIYTATTPGTWTSLILPVGQTSCIYSMRTYNSKLYVAFGTQVWRCLDLSFPTDRVKTWDGTTVFYKVNANSGSNFINSMETHLGFLYMLSSNGHLHRSDGNNTFDIWSWDGQTYGVSLRSYDGRLFVGTYEFTDVPDVGYGVLYQFTGAAVTELKRWGREGRYTSIGQMMVHGRKLYYGAAGLFGVRDGFGVAIYDAIEDAHSIWAMQDNAAAYTDPGGLGSAWMVTDVIVFGGRLFAAVRGHGVFFTPDSFKDNELGLSKYSTSTTGGEIVSSLYDGGTPGLDKLWSKITVYCDVPVSGTSFTLSYSINNGATWTATAAVAGPTTNNGQYVFYLNNIRSPRFKWKILLKTTDTTKTPLLRGVVVAYLPQPEPNWMWSFTIPIADKWELLDESVEVKGTGCMTTNQLIAYLEGLFRSGSLVTFVDIDGIQWATNGPGVIVYDMSTVHYDIESPNREGDIRITLLESVETY